MLQPGSDAVRLQRAGANRNAFINDSYITDQAPTGKSQALAAADEHGSSLPPPDARSSEPPLGTCATTAYCCDGPLTIADVLISA